MSLAVGPRTPWEMAGETTNGGSTVVSLLSQKENLKIIKAWEWEAAWWSCACVGPRTHSSALWEKKASSPHRKVDSVFHFVPILQMPLLLFPLPLPMELVSQRTPHPPKARDSGLLERRLYRDTLMQALLATASL